MDYQALSLQATRHPDFTIYQYGLKGEVKGVTFECTRSGNKLLIKYSNKQKFIPHSSDDIVINWKKNFTVLKRMVKRQFPMMKEEGIIITNKGSIIACNEDPILRYLEAWNAIE